jgi:hypothetical protein
MQASFSTDVFTPDRLIAGDEEILSRKVTILTGQTLVRGAVLGKITASGKYILSLSGASDGSEVPDAVLAQDVDATAADKEAMAYFTGRFNQDALTIGTAHTAASIREGLRVKGIQLVSVQPA